MTTDMNLGKLLGRREAFTIVAARCSAADAAILKQIRDEKLYLDYCSDWGDFCAAHLHTSKTAANRIIGLLNEFGPQYFEVAQLTRISPVTYRAIAPSIRDNALHTHGEAIALIPENADKVAAAVADLRKTVAKPQPEPPPPPPDPLRVLRDQCVEITDRFCQFIQKEEDLDSIRILLSNLMVRLNRIGMAMPFPGQRPRVT